MARSSGTRHGNGAGWGGSRKGPGIGGEAGREATRFQLGNQTAVGWASAEMRKRSELRNLAKAERKEAYLEALHEIFESPEATPTHKIQVVAHIMDRDFGKPAQEGDDASDGGTTIIVKGGLPADA